MDELFATNTGPPATAGDGAFERFLTAAIAAIITIMFSWRLLATEDNLVGGEGATGGAVGGAIGGEVPKVVMKKAIKMAKAAGYTEESKALEKEKGLCDEKGGSDERGSGVNTVTSSDLDTEPLITCWEKTSSLDDSGEVNVDSSEFETDLNQGINGFSRGNPEYRGIVGDDGYQPYDGEEEFGDDIQPRELDSDEEMYCATMLETIMEEDSDDMCSTSTGSDVDSVGRTGEWGYFDLNMEGEDEGEYASEGGCTVHVIDDGADLVTNVISVSTKPSTKGERDESKDSADDSVVGENVADDNEYVHREMAQLSSDTADDSNSDGSDESVITVVTRQISSDKDSPVSANEFNFQNTGHIEIVPVRTRATDQFVHVTPVTVQSTFQALQPDEPYPTEDQHLPGQDRGVSGINEGLNTDRNTHSPAISSPSLDSRVYSVGTRVGSETANRSPDKSGELEEKDDKFDINSNVDTIKNASAKYSTLSSASISDRGNVGETSDLNEVQESERKLDILFDQSADVPEYTDAYVSSAVEKTPKGFIFSRFELETTDYQEKLYTTDRPTHTVVAKLVAEEKFVPTDQTDSSIRDKFSHLDDGVKVKTSPETFVKADTQEADTNSEFPTDLGARTLVPEQEPGRTLTVQTEHRETNIDDQAGVTKRLHPTVHTTAPAEKYLRMDKTNGAKSHRIVPVRKEFSVADRLMKIDTSKLLDIHKGDPMGNSKRVSSLSTGDSPPEKVMRTGKNQGDGMADLHTKASGDSSGRILHIATDANETLIDDPRTFKSHQVLKLDKGSEKILKQSIGESRETLIDDVDIPVNMQNVEKNSTGVMKREHRETLIDDITTQATSRPSASGMEIVTKEMLIDDTTSKPKSEISVSGSKETLIDDLLLPLASAGSTKQQTEPSGRVETLTDDAIVTESNRDRQVIQVHGSRETAIDDVLVHVSNKHMKQPSHGSRETVIDDVIMPVSDIDAQLKRQTRASLETAIDDVILPMSDKHMKRQTRASLETAIDDVILPMSDKHMKRQTHASLETAIDDVITPVPNKGKQMNKPTRESRETAIDNVNESEMDVEKRETPPKAKLHISRSRETVIDDVLSKPDESQGTMTRHTSGGKETLVDGICVPVSKDNILSSTEQGARETLIDDRAVTMKVEGVSSRTEINQPSRVLKVNTESRETCIDDVDSITTSNSERLFHIETGTIQETKLDDVPQRLLNINRENIQRFRDRASLNRDGSCDDSTGNELDKSFGDVTNRSEDILQAPETETDDEEGWTVDEVIQEFTLKTDDDGVTTFIPGKVEHRIIQSSAEHRSATLGSPNTTPVHSAGPSPEYGQNKELSSDKQISSVLVSADDRPTPKPRRSLRSEESPQVTVSNSDPKMSPRTSTQISPDGKLHLDAIEEVSWKPLTDSETAEKSPSSYNKFVMEDVIISGSHLIPPPRRKAYSEADKSNPLVDMERGGGVGSYGTRADLVHLSSDLETEAEIDFETFSGGVGSPIAANLVSRPLSESSPKQELPDVVDGNDSPDESGFPSIEVRKTILEEFKRSKSVEHLRRKSWGNIEEESVFMPASPEKSKFSPEINESPVVKPSPVISPPVIPDSPVVSPPAKAFLVSKKGSKSVPNLAGIDDSPSIKAPMSHTVQINQNIKSQESPVNRKPSRYTKKSSTASSAPVVQASPVIKFAAKTRSAESQLAPRQVVETNVDDIIDGAISTEKSASAVPSPSPIESKQKIETSFGVEIASSPVISPPPVSLSVSPIVKPVINSPPQQQQIRNDVKAKESLATKRALPDLITTTTKNAGSTEASPSISISPKIDTITSSVYEKPEKDAKATRPGESPLIESSPSIQVSPLITSLKITNSSQRIPKSPQISSTPVVQKSPTVQLSKSVDTSPVVPTSETIQASPAIQDSPVIVTSPVIRASPVIPGSPLIQDSPVIPVSPLIQDSPVIPASPLIQDSPVIMASPLIQDSPVIPTSLSQDSPVTSSSQSIPDSPSLSIPDSPAVSVDDSSFEDQSSFRGQKKYKSLKEIKRKYSSKNFKSLQMPPTPNIGQFVVPAKAVLTARHRINASRKRFLSEENLISENRFSDQFKEHKESLVNTTKYKSPRRPDNKRPSSSSSQDSLDSFALMYPNFFLDESSEYRPSIDELHKNCIFTAEGRKDILNKTMSIENLTLDLGAHLKRFGSVTSLVETDIDTGETSETQPFPETDLDVWFSLQEPVDRAVSMTDLRSEHSHRSGKGRFANRNVPKSKSLQTLETNLDDDEDELKRTPSVHELRITKSLSKLNIPDWFKTSNLSKSGSCILRHGSTSTMSSWGFNPSLTSSPCPSVAPSGNVVIKTRVSPTSSMRFLKSPKFYSVPTLPKTPEEKVPPKTPVKLPSEKLRKEEKPKGLEKIPIVPFAQIRAMFEAKAANERAKKSSVRQDSVTSKTSEKSVVPVPVLTLSSSETPSEIVQLEGSPKRPRSPPVKPPSDLGARFTTVPTKRTVSPFDNVSTYPQKPESSTGSTSPQRPLSPSNSASPQRPLSPTEQRSLSPIQYSSPQRPLSPSESASPQRPQSPAESTSPRSLSPLGSLNSSAEGSRSFSPSDKMRPINPDGPHNRSMSPVGLFSSSRSISPGGILSPKGVNSSGDYSSPERPSSPQSPVEAPVAKPGPRSILGPTVRFEESERLEIRDNKPPQKPAKKTDFFKRLQVFQRSSGSEKDKEKKQKEENSSKSPQKQVPVSKIKSAFEPFTRKDNSSSRSVESAPTIQAPTSTPKSPANKDPGSKSVEEAPVIRAPNSKPVESTPSYPRYNDLPEMQPLDSSYRVMAPPVARYNRDNHTNDRNSHPHDETRRETKQESRASPVRVGNSGQSLPTPVLTATPFSRNSASEQSKRKPKGKKLLYSTGDNLENHNDHLQDSCLLLALAKHSGQLSPKEEGLLEGSGDVRVPWSDVSPDDVTDTARPLRHASVEDVLEGFLSFGNRSVRNRPVLNSALFERNGHATVPRTASEAGFSSVSKNGEKDVCTFSMNETSSVKCDNPVCVNSVLVNEAKTSYKLCPFCYTYYCSRQCRKNDLDAHKLKCHHSKVNSACKHVVMKINKDPEIQYKFSRLASLGYKSRGRGCLTLYVPDLYTAERFIHQESHTLKPPVFVPVSELSHSPVLGSMVKYVSDMCETYNAALTYVMHVAVGVGSALEQIPRPRSQDPVIQKCAKLRLSPAHDLPSETDENCHVMLLTAIRERNQDIKNPREIREASFMTIQRKLRNRGVNLRHEFPNSYNKLIDFVADGRTFTPEVIHPADSTSGDRFMCVIMMEPEADIEWLQTIEFPPDIDISADDRCPNSPNSP